MQLTELLKNTTEQHPDYLLVVCQLRRQIFGWEGLRVVEFSIWKNKLFRETSGEKISTFEPRFTAPLGEYFNDYVKRSLRCFEYFLVCLVLIGLEIILLYKELRCIDGSLYRGPTVIRKLVIKKLIN